MNKEQENYLRELAEYTDLTQKDGQVYWVHWVLELFKMLDEERAKNGKD